MWLSLSAGSLGFGEVVAVMMDSDGNIGSSELNDPSLTLGWVPESIEHSHMYGLDLWHANEAFTHFSCQCKNM